MTVGTKNYYVRTGQAPTVLPSDIWWELCRKHDYVRDPEKDLVVYIPTRNNPEGLKKTLNMMYNQCVSPDNFDIFIIVDRDQVELYGELRNELYEQVSRRNIFWSYPEHQGYDWWNIYESRYNFSMSNSYYFEALWTDDFQGLSRKWDENIIKKKKTFNDDIFSLYQNIEGTQGRQMHRYETCYTKQEGDVLSSSELVWNYSECLPVTTRKMALLVQELVKPNFFTAQSEMLIAGALMVLNRDYGENRLIDGSFGYKKIEDSKKSLQIGCGGFDSKEEHYQTWGEYQNFKVLQPVIKKLYNIIKQESNNG